MGEMVDHLKNFHKTFVCRPAESEEKRILLWPKEDIHRDKHFKPRIYRIGDQTYLLNCIKRDFTMIFWVTFVGKKNSADQRFEVEMRAVSPDGTLEERKRGKVYSVEMSQKDVLEDANGVMKISKGKSDELAYINRYKKNKDRPQWDIVVSYNIVRK